MSDDPERVPAQRQARRRTAILWAAVIAGIVLAAYLLISAMAADQLSRPPRAAGDITPADAGLDFREIQFPARHDSVRIAGWYIAQPGAAPAIVMAHGRHSSRATELDGRWIEVGEALWRAGFSVLMIDLRGHGRSGPGRISFGLRERRDVAGAVDWLRSGRYTAGTIGLLGVSLGGAAALGAAAETPEVAAVVADAVYADIGPIIEREWEEESGLPYIFWPSTRLMTRIMFGYDPAAARPVEDAAQMAPRPLLIIHGSRDRLVPPEHAGRLRAAHGTAQLSIIEDAGHAASFLRDPDAYTACITGFFEETLQRLPGEP